MYCVKCGAELDDYHEKCPLCESPVIKMENNENENIDNEKNTSFSDVQENIQN